jgi:hypothetical protein
VRSIAYEVDDAFSYAVNCHCSNCRRATGAAFKPLAGIQRHRLKIITGNDHIVIYGEERAHGVRCGTCGSLLYSVVREGAYVHIAIGSRPCGFDPLQPRRPVDGLSVPGQPFDPRRLCICDLRHADSEEARPFGFRRYLRALRHRSASSWHQHRTDVGLGEVAPIEQQRQPGFCGQRIAATVTEIQPGAVPALAVAQERFDGTAPVPSPDSPTEISTDTAHFL